MSKPVTVIVPSYCPDETVKGYETRCLQQLKDNTDPAMYDLILMGGGDWSYPKKVNAAVRRTQTEYVVILSNDVFVCPDWLPTMLRDFEKIPRCGILAPMDMPIPFPSLLPLDKRVLFDAHWFALVLMRTAQLRDFGCLDESLPLVYHDQALSIRMRAAGYWACRTWNVIVEHVNMATRSRIGTGDCAEERAEMLRRFGAAELKDWIALTCG